MEYEEKLNLAKKALESGSYDKSTIEYIFPELKESEDERVKRILNSISSKMARHLALIFTEEEYQCFDAWSYAWIKEQCNKPQDKSLIKPKFKVGDWITNSKGHSFLIRAIEDNRYFCENDGYTHEKLSWAFIKNADERYSLWSLEDADDGEILVHNKYNTIDGFDYIFIYNKTCLLQTYCYYSKEKGRAFVEDGSHYCPWNMTEVKPATKKQRDLLIQRMREIGCGWDADNKTITWSDIRHRY